MTNAEAYRSTAAAMRRRAEAAGTPEHRAAWALVATKWEALAREIESFDPPGNEKAEDPAEAPPRRG